MAKRIYILLLIVLLTAPAVSVGAKRVVNPSPERLKEVSSSSGATITCLFKERKQSYVPGFLIEKPRRTIWKRSRTQNKVKRLRSRVRSLKASGAPKKRIRKIRQRLKAQKEIFQQETAICNSDPVEPPGDPLAPLERSITRSDLKLLLERAAFGHGPRSSNVMDAGLSNGLDAAINALTSTRSEAGGVLTTFYDYGDTLNFDSMETGIFWLGAKTRNPFQYKLGFLVLGNTWVLNSRGVDGGFSPMNDRTPLWDYYKDLRTYGFNPDLKQMAEDYLTSIVMLRQYDNTGNVKGAHNYMYAEALLEYILPGTTDAEGNPRYEFSDLQAMAKVLSGWEVVPLVDGEGMTEYLPVFVNADHASGPHTLFSGTSDSCSADRLDDYLANCAFKGQGLARFYARKLLEFYLTPEPSNALVQAMAEEIADADFNLLPALKKLFSSEVFYSNAHRNTVPKHPLETSLSFLNILNLPFRLDTDSGGLQRYMERAGYHITETPAPEGYSQRGWTNMQTLITVRNVCERALEDVEAPERFFGDLGWDPADYLPDELEVLSSDLVEHAADVMGIESSTLNSSVMAAYQYYALHQRSQPGGVPTDTFTPYDNVGDHLRKGMGIYCVMKLSPPFLLK